MAPLSSPTVVLIVDDEPALLRALARLLRSAEVEVLIASGGSEALEILAARAIDIVLADVDMPEMSGFELLARVRKEYPSVIRMLLTGAPSVDRALQAINEGEVARFLVKPIEARQLRGTIASLRERVEQMRADDVRRLQRARSEAFLAWVETTFPATLDIRRDERGDVVVDAEAASLLLGR